MKIALMLVILIGSTAFGYSFSRVVKEKLNFFKDLYMFCSIVEGDIKFLKNNLKTIVLKNENAFTSCFKNVVTDYFVNKKPYEKLSILTEDENVFLKNFFESLGKFDVTGEIENIKNHKSEIERKINEKLEKFNKTGSLGTKLGFIFGLLICVVLI